MEPGQGGQDVEYGAATVALDDGGEGAGRDERAEEVGLHLPAHLVDVASEQRHTGGDARIVDQQCRVGRHAGGLLYRRLVRDVHSQRDDARDVDRLGASGRAVHLRAALDELGGQVPPEPPVGARDDRDRVLRFHACSWSWRAPSAARNELDYASNLNMSL